MENFSEQPLKQVMATLRERLAAKYGAGEARAMSQIIFENLKGWSPVDLVIRQDELISDFIQKKINDVVERLLQNEPIQQIFGNAHFYGMIFKVSRATLIPRQETAELIDLIVSENSSKDLRVLDCGTGSGCIAISLQRNLQFPQVTAIDISEDALKIAQENASKLRARVSFKRADILSLPGSLTDNEFDIIVSNPPYIAEHEKASMERNVLDFEPHTALFVPDNDPLKFYTAIMRAAKRGLLRDGGKLYFEINPLYSSELSAEANKEGFSDVTLHRDIHGKLRFLSAIKSSRK